MILIYKKNKDTIEVVRIFKKVGNFCYTQTQKQKTKTHIMVKSIHLSLLLESKNERFNKYC